MRCPSGHCVTSVRECPSPNQCTDEARRHLCFDGKTWQCMTLRQCLDTPSKGSEMISLLLSMTERKVKEWIKSHSPVLAFSSSAECPSEGVRCWSGECQPSVHDVRPSRKQKAPFLPFLTFLSFFLSSFLQTRKVQRSEEMSSRQAQEMC